jgi:hypothetical protein
VCKAFKACASSPAGFDDLLQQERHAEKYGHVQQRSHLSHVPHAECNGSLQSWRNSDLEGSQGRWTFEKSETVVQELGFALQGIARVVPNVANGVLQKWERPLSCRLIIARLQEVGKAYVCKTDLGKHVHF